MTEPLTVDDLARMRAYHQPKYLASCRCEAVWPCDAVRLCDEVERLRPKKAEAKPHPNEPALPGYCPGVWQIAVAVHRYSGGARGSCPVCGRQTFVNKANQICRQHKDRRAK